MEGKIFSDSVNIWQDQARILFNYYRQAAERIVSEEERIESQIADLQNQKAEVKHKLSKVWVWLFALVVPYFIKKKNLENQLASLEARIAEFQQMHREIFRDYKVSRLGVAYVPVAERVKYQDKSFIVDFTGSVPESDISMSVSRQNDLLIQTVRTLDQLSREAPVVETSEDAETVETDDYSLSIQEVKENDYIGALERSLKTLSFCMDDLDTTSVTLPVVTDNSPYLDELDSYATSKLPENATIVNVFNSEALEPGIEKFEQINDLKNTLSNESAKFEEVLKDLMHAIGYSVQTVARLKVASVDKIVLDSNRLLYQILKAPYNHYSPDLEAEEIERIKNEDFDYAEDVQGYEPFTLRQSSRVKYNPLTGTWVAEDGSQTLQPFGIHQMYEEIVAPMVENLMQENRVERLKIYNHIKDQKLSYLNKWHQDTDSFYISNRAESADLINLMQQTLTEYVGAYNNLIALKRTENQMSVSGGNLESTVVESVDNAEETVAAFELQSREFQKCQLEFEDYMDRLKEDIDLKAARFGHVEFFDAKLRDGYSNSVATAAAEVHDLDGRRKALAIVNPKLAKDSELLPEPQVESVAHEHFAINLPVMVREAMAALNSEASDGNVALESNGVKEENDIPQEIQSSPSDEYQQNENSEEPSEHSAEDEMISEEQYPNGEADESQDEEKFYNQNPPADDAEEEYPGGNFEESENNSVEDDAENHEDENGYDDVDDESTSLPPIPPSAPMPPTPNTPPAPPVSPTQG